MNANVKYIYESQFLKYVRLACDDGVFFLKQNERQIKKKLSLSLLMHVYMLMDVLLNVSVSVL